MSIRDRTTHRLLSVWIHSSVAERDRGAAAHVSANGVEKSLYVSFVSPVRCVWMNVEVLTLDRVRSIHGTRHPGKRRR